MLLLAIITAFLISNFCIPSIIQLANQKKLFDLPDGRKQHIQPTPALGGVVVMLATAIAYSLFMGGVGSTFTGPLFFAVIILFAMGLKDDLIPINSKLKFLVQILVSCAIVFQGHRITSLFGIFGIHEIPTSLQYIISVLFLVGITNAYNLIDGINGLLGGISVVGLLAMTYFFHQSGFVTESILAASLVGAIIGFLRFNWIKGEIFMGDSGSLCIGFIIAALSIRLVNLAAIPNVLEIQSVYIIPLVYSIIVIPLADTLQVFINRILHGKSPFTPDRGHLHHRLLFLGMSHLKASLTLLGTLCCFLALSIVGLYFQVPIYLLLGYLSIGTLVLVVGLCHKTQERAGFHQIRIQELPSTIFGRLIYTLQTYLF